MHRIVALLSWAAGPAIALTLAGVGLWAQSDLRPPGEEQRLAVSYLWMFWFVAVVGTLLFVALRLLWPAERRAWLVGGVIASLVFAGIAGATYVWSWSVYTLWISPQPTSATARGIDDPRGFRIFRSHAYTEPVHDQWKIEREAGQPPTSIDDLLISASFKTEDIFAERSRDILPLLVLGSWSVLCFSLVAASHFLLRLTEHALRAEDPALAALRARLEPVRDKLPEQFVRQLDNAIDTLGKAGNVSGTVVSVAGLFAGRYGLLARLVTEEQAAAEARMAEWNDKESKSLRRKYETQGYDKLDFLEQIEVVRMAGLVTPTIASDLHWIRMRGNEARHANAPTMPRQDALKALEFAVDIACWYAASAADRPLQPKTENGTPSSQD